MRYRIVKALFGMERKEDGLWPILPVVFFQKLDILCQEHSISVVLEEVVQKENEDKSPGLMFPDLIDKYKAYLVDVAMHPDKPEGVAHRLLSRMRGEDV